MREARQNPAFDITRSWTLPDVPVLPGDEAFGAYLRRIGFSDEQLEYTRRAFANASGDSMEYRSAEAALAEMHDSSVGENDFRILDGYDSLINHLAEGLDLRLNTLVKRITWSGAGVQVETSTGMFEAENAIITLPLGVLQAGTVLFDPPLPAHKQNAINGLRMGPGIKLVYRFEQSIAPEGIMALYSAGTPPMWWSPSFGHETNQVVWTAFCTGDYARELLSLGETGALKRALETLRGELRQPDLQPIDCHLMNWVADPLALGAYSVTPPGGMGARETLAEPIGRLFWAGEATAPEAGAATVHGAYASGQRAAADVLAAAHP